MNNFEKLKLECDNYYKQNINTEREFLKNNDDVCYTWGYTPFESFKEIISNVNKPNRFIVYGCSIGYQCFFWNHFFPDIPVIGVDLLEHRINWGLQKIKEYDIKNVQLIQGDISDIDISDSDLIWQNDLLFDDELIFNLTYHNLSNFDVNIISYKTICKFIDNDFYNLRDQYILVKDKFIKIEEVVFKSKTSWLSDHSFSFYKREVQVNDSIIDDFDVNYIHQELKIPENLLKSYWDMNTSRRFVKLPLFKNLYNKKNLKQLFTDFNFKVPETYFYTTEKKEIKDILQSLESFVAKPAHMSESVNVFVSKKNKKIDLNLINQKMNDSLDISDFENFRRLKIDGGVWWKDTERGFLIEQCIDVKFELKVFVLWGQPFIGDLRSGPTEFDRVDFITKENRYLDWSDEFEKIKDLAKYLKVDFFRIDFLCDGAVNWSSELAFMPGTILPIQIEEKILNTWRNPYFKYYYPHLS